MEMIQITTNTDKIKINTGLSFFIWPFAAINKILLEIMIIVEYRNQLGDSGNCILSTKIKDDSPAKNIQILPIPIHNNCIIACLFLMSIVE